MIEVIFSITLVISLTVIGIIIFQKIPLLLKLPKTSPSHFDWRDLFNRLKGSIPIKESSADMLLQKILSKVRVLTLKTENKTSNLLQKLRERSIKKKFGDNDNYWKEIKKSTKKR